MSAPQRIRALEIEPLRPNPTTFQKRENGTKLGIVLTSLGALATLGAVGLITFTALKYSPSSNLFKGLVGGGAGMVVVGLSGIGTGIYFIKKTYWKDPIVCNEVKAEIERNNYTFQEILNRYPTQVIKNIISEQKLAEKFLEYVKNWDYSKIVQSFYGNHPSMDRSLNPWGIKFDDSFVPLRVLEERAKAEIRSYCSISNHPDWISPEQIQLHYDRKGITNPLRNGVVKWTDFQNSFESAANSYDYGQMKAYLKGIVPNECLRVGLAHQFRNIHQRNFTNFKNSHGPSFYAMIKEGVVIDISEQQRKAVDSNGAQLFIPELRVAVREEARANKYTYKDIIQNYGAEITCIVDKDDVKAIIINDIMDKDLRYDQIKDHFKEIDVFSYISKTDPLIKECMIKTLVQFSFCWPYSLYKMDVVNLAEHKWNLHGFACLYDNAVADNTAQKNEARRVYDAAVATAESVRENDLKPFKERIQEVNARIAKNKSKYVTDKAALELQLVHFRTIYNRSVLRNPYGVKVFNSQRSYEGRFELLQRREAEALRNLQMASSATAVTHNNSKMQKARTRMQTAQLQGGANLRAHGRPVHTRSQEESLRIAQEAVRTEYAQKRAAWKAKQQYLIATAQIMGGIETLNSNFAESSGRLGGELTTAQQELTKAENGWVKQKYDKAIKQADMIRVAACEQADTLLKQKYDEIDQEFRKFIAPSMSSEVPASAYQGKNSDEFAEREAARLAAESERERDEVEVIATNGASLSDAIDGPVPLPQPIPVPGAEPPPGYQPINLPPK